MKIVKNIIIIFLIAFVLWLVLVLIEYNRFVNNNKDPFLYLSKIETDNGDIVYKGLLYNVIIYKDTSQNPISGKIKSKTFKVLFFNKTLYKKGVYSSFPVDNSEFEILDLTTDCIENKEEFYRDNDYIYYFNCSKTNTTFIKLDNDNQFTIKDALEKGIVTIRQIDEKGLSYSKEIYEDVIEKIDYNKLIELLNKKETFILVLMRSECGHCIKYEPKFNNILGKYNLTAKSIDIGVELNKKVNNLFKIEGTPTTIFIENGKEINEDIRIVGNQDESLIISILKKAGYIK